MEPTSRISGGEPGGVAGIVRECVKESEVKRGGPQTLCGPPQTPAVSAEFPTGKGFPSAAYLLSFEIFEPSSVRLYIRPCCPTTKPTIGLFAFVVSMEASAPRSTITTDPSTPICQP